MLITQMHQQKDEVSNHDNCFAKGRQSLDGGQYDSNRIW